MPSVCRLPFLVTLLVLGTHLWLTPFAFANPPDSIETGGLFDEGDFDDIVLVVMAMHGLVDTRPMFEGVHEVVVSFAQPAELPPPLPAPIRALGIRAPPA